MIFRSYTIRFVLHRRTDTPRQHLQMRVTPRGGKPISFSTGISLTAAEWDANLGRAKGRTPQAAEANTLIADWSQTIANIFSHYDSLNITPTADQLRKAFAIATTESTTASYTPQPTSSTTLIAAFTRFMTDPNNLNTWSQGTNHILRSYRHLLSDYIPDTPINNIDEAWMQQFHQWLVTARNQQGVTVHGNLVKLRWFLRWAKKNGYYNGTADQDYRPKVKGANEKTRSIVFLTRDELHRLETYQPVEDYLIVARDAFLFACYTGLRWSDVIKLSRADIHTDHITFTTQKTHHTLTVPLNDRARAILDTYADSRPNRRQRVLGLNTPAIPCPAIKTMNKHLHPLMQAAGINAPTHHIYYIGSTRHEETLPKYQLISTHTARHTFIVTAISLGIPVSVIMEWTGHSNYNSMRPYIAIANDTSTQAMQLFNTL